jgi:hypothetical protein
MNVIKIFVGTVIFFSLMSIPVVNVAVVTMVGVGMTIGLIRYIKAQM